MTTKKTALCYFCGGALRSLDDAFIEFADQEVGPPFKAPMHPHPGQPEGRSSLSYPGLGPEYVKMGKWNAFREIMFYSHAECGPELPYSIALWQVKTPEDLERFQDHISRKRWCGLNVHGELDEAHRIARGLAKRKKAKVSP